MKIYFAGSISGGRADVALYKELIDYIKNYGTVLTEFIGHSELTEKGENHLTDKEIHNRDIEWLFEADILIAEVSTPSLGVGYEIGRAFEKGKKILCLYRHQPDKRLSAMISGNDSIFTVRYKDLEEAKSIINRFLRK
jgi:nucleoside 2-deoxyribosyltransferase